MDAKTTKMIGGFVGLLVGVFAGAKWGGVANAATTEIIDNVDSDLDDVNKPPVKKVSEHDAK